MQNISHTTSQQITEDIPNFTLKLIDHENKKIKFEDKEKKFPRVNFLLEFLA